jgi:phage-related protein
MKLHIYRRPGMTGRIGLALLLFSAISGLVACGDWVSQATSIINLLVPAIEAALGILMAFGVGVSPDVMTQVQKWATESVATLTNVVKPLIESFKTAEASAQPGILTEIQAALQVIVDNLNTILPAIHVVNPDVQQKIMGVIQAVLAETMALLGMIPVLTGNVTDHGEVKARMHALRTADQFKAHFNELAASFGPQYQIH